MRWFISRVSSMLFTYRPYERKVLLWLAVLRAELTVAPAWLFLPWRASLLVAVLAPLCAVLCADFVEHLIRQRLLGYAYNPFVSAIGEWEGWMGPTDPKDHEGIATWNAMKCGPPPGGNANPLMGWWGNPGSGTFCE